MENDLNFELSLSPGYRWKYGIQYQDDICRSWLEYDIYSSYVMRLWTGGGIKYKEKNTVPFMQTRLQMDFGKIQFNCGWQYDREGWKENTKEIVYQINVVFFDEFRAEQKGLNYAVKSYRRILILLLQSLFPLLNALP